MPHHADAKPGNGIWLAFICLLLLGLMPIISNGRPAGSGALTFAVWLSIWQFLFSLPLLLLEWRARVRRGVPTAVAGRRPGRLVAVTLFTGALFGVSTWLYVLGFEKAGAVNAAIALQMYPLFAAGLEALLLGRRKSLRELGFMLLIVGALFHLATHGTWRPQGLSVWFLVALLVPAIWSVAHVILRQALVTTPITPNQVTASRLAVSTVVLLPLALAVDGPDAVLGGARDLGFQSFAVMMGLAYYVELILWFNAVRHIDVSLASSITVPAPVVTMILAAIVLGDSIEAVQIVTLGVIVAGLFGLLHAGARDRRRRSLAPAV